MRQNINLQQLEIDKKRKQQRQDLSLIASIYEQREEDQQQNQEVQQSENQQNLKNSFLFNGGEAQKDLEGQFQKQPKKEDFLKDLIKQSFRIISDSQEKLRFGSLFQKILELKIETNYIGLERIFRLVTKESYLLLSDLLNLCFKMVDQSNEIYQGYFISQKEVEFQNFTKKKSVGQQYTEIQQRRLEQENFKFNPNSFMELIVLVTYLLQRDKIMDFLKADFYDAQQKFEGFGLLFKISKGLKEKSYLDENEKRIVRQLDKEQVYSKKLGLNYSNKGSDNKQQIKLNKTERTPQNQRKNYSRFDTNSSILATNESLQKQNSQENFINDKLENEENKTQETELETSRTIKNSLNKSQAEKQSIFFYGKKTDCNYQNNQTSVQNYLKESQNVCDSSELFKQKQNQQIKQFFNKKDENNQNLKIIKSGSLQIFKKINQLNRNPLETDKLPQIITPYQIKIKDSQLRFNILKYKNQSESLKNQINPTLFHSPLSPTNSSAYESISKILEEKNKDKSSFQLNSPHFMRPQKREPKANSHKKFLFQDVPALDIDKFLYKKKSILENDFELKFLI